MANLCGCKFLNSQYMILVGLAIDPLRQIFLPTIKFIMVYASG
jgi:hypothetical protein